MSDLHKKTELFAHLLICPDRPEWIAQICSFVMSNLSDVLPVAHLSWATWANRSHLLICSEWFEQMSEWANEQLSKFPTLPNPLRAWLNLQIFWNWTHIDSNVYIVENHKKLNNATLIYIYICSCTVQNNDNIRVMYPSPYLPVSSCN